jgi:N6-adenosine-specific RNA methylase IME4
VNVATILAPNTSDRAEWAARIRAAWQSTVESIFETGRLIAAAKDELDHGEFLEMVTTDLPFGARTAQRLMAVAEDERLSNTTHASLLPPSWMTLYEITKLSDDEFEAKVADGTIHPEMQRRDLIDWEAKRERKLGDIAAASRELPTGIRYPIIYADPPWRYENPPIGSQSRAIENHYPTMGLEEICALPVAALAFDDALLFLWATAPKLYECMKVIDAWGFDYRTCLVWDKEKIGMGYYARNQHELLLIAKRGDIPPPAEGSQHSSVYREARGEHSAKPVFYYEMIEAAYPQLPKIELFSRSPRFGWAAWGNQAEAA